MCTRARRSVNQDDALPAQASLTRSFMCGLGEGCMSDDGSGVACSNLVSELGSGVAWVGATTQEISKCYTGELSDIRCSSAKSVDTPDGCRVV